MVKGLGKGIREGVSVQVTHHPWINCNPQKHKGVLVVVSVAIHAWPALTFHECHSTQNNSTSARLGRQCPPCPTRKHVRSQGFPAPRRHPHLRPRCLTHQARQPRRRAPEAFQIPPSVWQGSLCRERYSTAMLRRGLCPGRTQPLWPARSLPGMAPCTHPGRDCAYQALRSPPFDIVPSNEGRLP